MNAPENGKKEKTRKFCSDTHVKNAKNTGSSIDLKPMKSYYHVFRCN